MLKLILASGVKDFRKILLVYDILSIHVTLLVLLEFNGFGSFSNMNIYA